MKVVNFGYGHHERSVAVTEEQEEALDRMEDDFYRYFWSEKIGWLNNEGRTRNGAITAIIKGSHYTIQDENSNSGFKGMAGAKTTITFFAGPHKGKVIKSTNLWHQGEIPEELKDVLADNATIEWK